MPSRIDLPPMFDFIFERDELADLAPDPLETFLFDCDCAGSLKGMSSEVAHRYIHNLNVESQERTRKFAKRFAAAAPADSKTLAKNSSPGNRIDKTDYPLSGISICAEIDESGAVVRVYEEPIA